MKKPYPWFRFGRGWYVEIDDVQHFLGPHPDGAPAPQKSNKTRLWNPPDAILSAFHERMLTLKSQVDERPNTVLLPASAPLKSGPPCLTVAKVCDEFLAYSEKHNDAETYRWYKSYLDDLCNYADEQVGRLGHLPGSLLLPKHVTAWLDSHQGWTTGRGCAIRAIKRAFNWADAEGHLRPNPIKGVKREPVPSRGRTLTREQRKEILDAIDDIEFRNFVEAMQESGARPSEIARLEASNVDLVSGICTLEEHKTRKKTRRPRVLYMTPRFVEIVTALMKKHPEGPLFRGPRLKKPFGRQGIASRFRRLREKLPHLKDAIAYAYRASFTTDALMNGVGVAQVAELLGHTTTDQVMRHYSAIRDRTEYMREEAKKATRGG